MKPNQEQVEAEILALAGKRLHLDVDVEQLFALWSCVHASEALLSPRGKDLNEALKRLTQEFEGALRRVAPISLQSFQEVSEETRAQCDLCDARTIMGILQQRFSIAEPLAFEVATEIIKGLRHG